MNHAVKAKKSAKGVLCKSLHWRHPHKSQGLHPQQSAILATLQFDTVRRVFGSSGFRSVSQASANPGGVVGKLTLLCAGDDHVIAAMTDLGVDQVKANFRWI